MKSGEYILEFLLDVMEMLIGDSSFSGCENRDCGSGYDKKYDRKCEKWRKCEAGQNLNSNRLESLGFNLTFYRHYPIVPNKICSIAVKVDKAL